MPVIMDWSQGDVHEALGRVQEHLERGRPVAFATEAAYEVVVNALAAEAPAQLERGAAGKRATLILAHGVQVLDWLPYLPRVGQRLIRRFWPGPLTLVCGAGLAQGQAAFLPEVVRRQLVRDEALALRLPDNPALRLTALRCPFPLAAVPTPWTEPEQAAAHLPNDTLVLGRNSELLGRPASVVRVQGRQWLLEEEGAITAEEIEENVPCHIVFVCTGNTCRSPLAQGLCVKLLCDRLGCTSDELPRRGFRVQSAGLAAMMGAEATPEAVDIAREMGADLERHRSQPLSVELLARADHLFAMTASHLRMLEGVRGIVEPRLLSSAGEDVTDPIGGTPEIYRECARQILEHLEKILPELQEE